MFKIIQTHLPVIEFSELEFYDIAITGVVYVYFHKQTFTFH